MIRRLSTLALALVVLALVAVALSDTSPYPGYVEYQFGGWSFWTPSYSHHPWDPRYWR